MIRTVTSSIVVGTIAAVATTGLEAPTNPYAALMVATVGLVGAAITALVLWFVDRKKPVEALAASVAAHIDVCPQRERIVEIEKEARAIRSDVVSIEDKILETKEAILTAIEKGREHAVTDSRALDAKIANLDERFGQRFAALRDEVHQVRLQLSAVEQAMAARILALERVK